MVLSAVHSGGLKFAHAVAAVEPLPAMSSAAAASAEEASGGTGTLISGLGSVGKVGMCRLRTWHRHGS